jgi:hypothetical protein
MYYCEMSDGRFRGIVGRELSCNDTIVEALRRLGCWFHSGCHCGPSIVSSSTRTDAARSRSCSMRRPTSSQLKRRKFIGQPITITKKKKRNIGKVTQKQRSF